MEVETITKETIKVEGMSCGHCEMRVKKAVEAVEGVQKSRSKPSKKAGSH